MRYTCMYYRHDGMDPPRIQANLDKKIDVFVNGGFSFVSKCNKDVDICW